MDELKAKVLQKVKGDVLAADMVWSLFYSALHSYRHDSVLRPFPADYMPSEGEKDFTALDSVSEEIPNLKMLMKTTSTASNSSLSEQAWKLLSWAVTDKSLTVVSHDKNRFDRIQDLTGHSSYKVKPTHVFEIQYHSAANNRFDQLSQDKDIMYAYHGSRLENFHSIIHNGLHSHMSKKPLFGEGTYLSSDLSVSMPYSPIGKAWDHSVIGDKLSCVAVCELIDHPDVKCSTKAKGEGPNGGDRQRSQAPDSLGGDVPEKYYVVTNNEVVRVKYLLIFADNVSRKRSIHQRSKVMTFLERDAQSIGDGRQSVRSHHSIHSHHSKKSLNTSKAPSVHSNNFYPAPPFQQSQPPPPPQQKPPPPSPPPQDQRTPPRMNMIPPRPEYDDDEESQDFDDLIFALKTGGAYVSSPEASPFPPGKQFDRSPSRQSEGWDQTRNSDSMLLDETVDDSQAHYEMRRINIADTHL